VRGRPLHHPTPTLPRRKCHKCHKCHGPCWATSYDDGFQLQSVMGSVIPVIGAIRSGVKSLATGRKRAIGLTLPQSSRGEPAWRRADDSPRAWNEETSGDAGRCTQSQDFCAKAAFGNVALSAAPARDRLNACRRPDGTALTADLHVPWLSTEARYSQAWRSKTPRRINSMCGE